ncbi:MAG: N-formylglutamate amidohydrolase [Paracoccus sp. (in: a-proteobacteria)]|uniref:N-formylglutamate amidohydrolase n=1 Tax=unclassified Paracoccus (in: a-proteobacteria) TaxID=2688777 RepID=UPI00233C9BF1|nr:MULTISPECIES: N-formylglutamate amidohydrolase [unclassified Paracoccus (in: a-proteobacteria)]MCS5600658.1 N-formylglutamate amidohydrolase [Paracoccus sp. (in: a-proteobacteria)]MDB2490167.1 N-formylglutamate amidohydrolase [Paracoccus sp. (in: a-proteobacteria)]
MSLSDLPFSLVRPARWASGVIMASPHSGRDYPEWFLAGTRLPIPVLRSSEDAFMDRLTACASDHGAVTLAAKVPRCIVDLNRGADEIDPLVVRGVPRHPLNQRTLAGLGVIPRVVSQGRTIHDRPIDRAEAERRIAACWRPYHAMLAGLIAEARTTFGQAILIDMHSMPHDALSHLQGPRPDMVLGNRHGLSASARVSDIVAAAFEAEGWRIRRNSPFSGAYICSAYGRPGRNVHVVQIEIDRALYMDEKSLTPLPDFDRFAERLGRVIRKLAVIDDADGTGARIAAE